jgi:hypothetical protein
LKTVYFKETIVLGYFLGWSSAKCVFFQLSIYHRAAAASSSIAMVGVTPYKLFLKVPWAKKHFVSNNFPTGIEKRQLVQNPAKSEGGVIHLNVFIADSNCYNGVTIGTWAMAWQNTSFLPTC